VLPTTGLKTREIDVTGILFENMTAVETETNGRIGGWNHQIPETDTLLGRGWRLSQLVASDIVHLSTSHVGGYDSGGGGYANATAMVTRVDPFVGANTRIQLAIPISVT
jgi:hypothetical protein